MKPPSKFQLMRANRRQARTWALRDEARAEGYDETGDAQTAAIAEAMRALPARFRTRKPNRWPWWLPILKRNT